MREKFASTYISICNRLPLNIRKFNPIQKQKSLRRVTVQSKNIQFKVCNNNIIHGNIIIVIKKLKTYQHIPRFTRSIDVLDSNNTKIDKINFNTGYKTLYPLTSLDQFDCERQNPAQHCSKVELVQKISLRKKSKNIDFLTLRWCLIVSMEIAPSSYSNLSMIGYWIETAFRDSRVMVQYCSEVLLARERAMSCL